jgi:futalosine hydrolase
MKLLIVAATELEAETIEKKMWKENSHQVDFLITGVGMPSTTYSLTKRLSKKRYDLALNIGLAGTFREEINIGEVVNVVTDCFADLGAEDGEKFLTINQLGLFDEDKFPFWNGKLKTDEAQNHRSLTPLKNVKGITVNTVHGNETSIHRVIQKFHADIESMEGAAFIYVCLMEKIPCIQLRAISNRVEHRNRALWNIELALRNLNEVLSHFIAGIEEIKLS